MAYKQIKYLHLRKGSPSWYMACKEHNDWQDLPVHLRMKIYRCIVPKPDVCPGCGSPTVFMFSRSGGYLDDPHDYRYECRKCHQGHQPIKYPGRPKGSKNKTIISKEKSMTAWEKLCAAAEKELYGKNSTN